MQPGMGIHAGLPMRRLGAHHQHAILVLTPSLTGVPQPAATRAWPPHLPAEECRYLENVSHRRYRRALREGQQGNRERNGWNPRGGKQEWVLQHSG